MKHTHTPGPWIAYDMGNGMRVTPSSVQEDLLPQFSATKNEIALLKPTAGANEWSYEMWEIQKANACLIAAAPELLAALERLHSVAGGFEDDSLEAALDQALEAIYKSRGES